MVGTKPQPLTLSLREAAKIFAQVAVVAVLWTYGIGLLIVLALAAYWKLCGC